MTINSLNFGSLQTQTNNAALPNGSNGQATTSYKETIKQIKEDHSLIVQVLNVTISQLRFNDSEKVMLQALFGLCGGEVEFASFYQTIAKQIWEKEKFLSYFTNSEEYESDYNRMVRDRLKSIDSKQKDLKIPIIDWTPGDKLEDGRAIPSKFRFYLVDYVYQAWELTQAERCFKKNPDQAIRQAVTKVLEQLLTEPKEAKGSSRKLNLSPTQQSERLFKASIGTMKTGFKALRASSLPPEGISQIADRYRETFLQELERTLEETIEHCKQQEQSLALATIPNPVSLEIALDDYLSVGKKVVISQNEDLLNQIEPKSKDHNNLTTTLVKADLEKDPEQNLDLAEETPGLEGGEGVQIRIVEPIDVETPIIPITNEKETNLIENKITSSALAMDTAIEKALEINFSPIGEERSFSRNEGAKPYQRSEKKSRFTSKECLLYAYSLKGIHTPEIFARTIERSGEYDKQIAEFLEARAIAEQKAKLEQDREKKEAERLRLEYERDLQREQLKDQLWDKLTTEEQKQLTQEKIVELFSSRLAPSYRRMPPELLQQHAGNQVKKDLLLSIENQDL